MSGNPFLSASAKKIGTDSLAAGTAERTNCYFYSRNGYKKDSPRRTGGNYFNP